MKWLLTLSSSKQNEKEDATVTDYTIAIIAQSSIDHVEHTIAFHSKLQ